MKQIKRLQIGKGGVSPMFVNQVKEIFKKEEVLKVSILSSICKNKKEAQKISKELVSSLGDKFVYKLVGHVITIRKFKRKKTQ